MANKTKLFILFIFLSLPTLLLYLFKSNGPKRPSILIIAVDQLGYFDFNCLPNNSMNNPAALLICPESLRFTHAYTTSPLSAPAVTSLLTGLYPLDHRVHNNGQPGLSPKFLTVAEAALNLKYKTSFFSGGTPILRRTGVNQGFELFEDRLTFHSGSFFRPLSHMVGSFEDWLTDSVKASPFFSVIYVNELTYATTQNFDESGKPMKLGFETQTTLFFQSLSKLFNFLKKTDRWDHTHIVIVGLNGRNTKQHPNELNPLNLYSENTHITLLFKPAQKKRDYGRSWKNDQNVNLADLGRTFFDLIQTQYPKPQSYEDFPILSLTKFLNGFPENEVAYNTRPILLESDWANWHNYGNTRYALIYDYYFLLNDSKLKIFNTLADNLESTPLNTKSINSEILENYQQLVVKYNLEPFNLSNLPKVNPFQIPSEDWLLEELEPDLIAELLELKKRNPTNVEYHNLLSYYLINRKDWKTLQSISNSPLFKNTYRIAKAQINKSFKTSYLDFSDSQCPEAIPFSKLTFSDIKKCKNPYLSAFLLFMNAKKLGLSPELSKNKFQQLLGFLQLEQYIYIQNMANSLTWDPLTTSPFPNLIQLILSLPDPTFEPFSNLKTPLPRPIESEFIEE